MSSTGAIRLDAVRNAARRVIDCFRESEWVRDNMRITAENWNLIDHEPDSLGRVELVMAAEQAFGVEIRAETFLHCKTMGELAEVIAGQLVDNPTRKLSLVEYDASLKMRPPTGTRQ